MKHFDNILFGNGISIKIFNMLRDNGIDIIDFYDYLEYFLKLESHKREKRDFNKIYLQLVWEYEAQKSINFLIDNLDEIKAVGFERMMSSKPFLSNEVEYSRLMKTVSAFYFLLFNYWYIRHVIPLHNPIAHYTKNLSSKIQTLCNDSIYTLNFDKLLDLNIKTKHVHGAFVDILNSFNDIVACKTSDTTFLYAYLFGTQGLEKLKGLNEVKQHKVVNFDYEFMFSDKYFGDLLIYGVAFGNSNILPKEIEQKYDTKVIFLFKCIEGHILYRLDALYKNNKINSITIAYYNEDDLHNYEQIFKHFDFNKIISYIKCSEIL